MTQNADERLNLFIARVRREQQVWALVEADEWWMLQAADETSLPVWPSEEDAALWSAAHAPSASPAAITLALWLERWTPGLVEEHITLAVYPTENPDTVVLEAEALAELLQEDPEQQ